MDIILSAIDQNFISIDSRSRELLKKLSEDQLFTKPRELHSSMAMFSCGEYILRSAAMVEKTFGGITTRLWDDPFEWTLPEKMFNKISISHYLDEVAASRIKGMAFFSSDDDLKRQIPAPKLLRPLIDILLDALTKASHFQGRAFAVFHMISDKKLPRL